MRGPIFVAIKRMSGSESVARNTALAFDFTPSRHVLANAVNRPPTATKNHRLRAVVFDTEIDELVPVDYTNERTRDCTESGSNFLEEIEIWTS